MSVMLISGEDGFSRRRYVRQVEKAAFSRGFSVERYSGKDREGISSLLMNSGFFLRSGQVLAVIETLGDLPLDLILDHAFEKTRSNPQVEVLVHCQSKSKANSSFGKLAKKLPKGGHKTFSNPSFWKANEAASQFCIQEAKRLGSVIDIRLASALVDRVGTDYGLLSFEIMKAVALMKAEGESEISPDIIRGSLSSISEASIFLPLTNALGSKNLPKVLRVLNRIESTHRGDPTMRVVGSIYKTVVLWVQVKNLSDRRLPDNQAAEILSQNLWRYKNVLLPITSRWSQRELLDLIRHLSEAQRVVLGGSINPWSYLVSGVVQIISKDE